MALKVELKPGEKIILGDCVVTNSDQRTRLYIQGKSPILREKDIMTVEKADTPAKRIYLCVQLMYLDEDIETMRENYFSLVNDVISAAPSTTLMIDEINNQILTGSLYKALKEAKQLVAYEKELLENATVSSPSVQPDSKVNG